MSERDGKALRNQSRSIHIPADFNERKSYALELFSHLSGDGQKEVIALAAVLASRQ